MRTDKTREEFDYEKSKDELTFKPKMVTKPGQSSATKKGDNATNNKYVQRQLERMERAREEKERIRLMM